MAKDARIDLVLNTSKAIAEAQKFGPALEKAIKIDGAGNKFLERQQELLKENLSDARLFNKETGNLAKGFTSKGLDEYQGKLSGILTTVDEIEQNEKQLAETQATIAKLGGTGKESVKSLASAIGGSKDKDAARARWEEAKSQLEQAKVKEVELLAENQKLNASFDQQYSKIKYIVTTMDAVKSASSENADRVEAINSTYDAITEKTKQEADNEEQLKQSTQGVADATNQVAESEKKAADAANEYANAKAKQSEAGAKDTSTEQISDETEKAAERTRKAAEELQKLRATIVTLKTDVTSVANAMKMDPANENIAELIRRYNTLRSAKQSVEKMGMPSELDATYRTTLTLLAQITQQINEYKRNLAGVSTTTATASKSTSNFGKTAKKAISGISSLLKTVKSGFSKLGGAIKSVKSHFDRMSSSMKRDFKHHLTSITKYVLGFRSLFFLVRRLRKYIGEGIKNMAQFNDGNNHVNQSITRLLSSLLYLKNAWATAFSPILQLVTPILEKLIDGLAEAGNAFSRFIGVLTGKTTVFQAVKTDAQDYASSLNNVGSGAGGAADKVKKLTDRLAAFDDLNVLGKDNDDDTNGGGGGGSGLNGYEPNPNDMFTIIDAYSDFADKLKDAFAQDGFFGIGKVISDSVSNWLENIDWVAVKQKANEIGTAIGDLFRGLFGNPDFWSNLGDAGAGIANALIYGLKGFLDANKDAHYGKMIADGFNAFLRNTDWRQAGLNVHDFCVGILDNIVEFFKTVNTEDFDKSLHDFFGNVKLGDIAWKIGEVVVEAGKAILHVATELIIEGGEELGESWWEKFDAGKDYYNNEEDYKKLMKTAEIADGLEQTMKTIKVQSVITPFAKLAEVWNNAAFDPDKEAHEERMKQLQERQLEVYRTAKSYDALWASQNALVADGLGEMKYYEGLLSELKKITDENGNIQRGYEGRANFIVTTLNEALGTEFSITDNIVQNYNGMVAATDLLIERKKAQIILEAQEAMYSEAIKNREQEVYKLAAAEEDYQNALTKRSDLLGTYNAVLGMTYQEALDFTEEIEGLWNTPGYVISDEDAERYRQASDWIQMHIDDLKDLNEEVASTKKIYEDQTYVVDKYTQDIMTYESNLLAYEEGRYDDMITNFVDYNDAFAEEEDKQRAALEQAVKNQIQVIESLKRLQADGHKEITDADIQAATEELDRLQANLDQYNRYVETGLDETTAIWKNGLDNQLSEISGYDVRFQELANGQVQLFINEYAVGTPLAKDEAAKFATGVISELMVMPEKAEEYGIKTVEGTTEGISNKEAQAGAETAVKDVGQIILDAFANAFDTHSPSRKTEEMGIDLLRGAKRGIGNQDEQNNVFNKIKTFGENLLKKFKGSLEERSPSKATEEMGAFLLQGLGIGVEGEEDSIVKQVVSAGSHILDAFTSLEGGSNSPFDNMLISITDFIDAVITKADILIAKIEELATLHVATLNIPNITVPSIAQGNIIPVSKEFLTSVGGDAHSSNEYDTIKQAVAEVLANNGNAEVIQLLQQLIGVVENKELVIGDKEIGKANARYTNRQNLIRGTVY